MGIQLHSPILEIVIEICPNVIVKIPRITPGFCVGARNTDMGILRKIHFGQKVCLNLDFDKYFLNF